MTDEGSNKMVKFMTQLIIQSECLISFKSSFLQLSIDQTNQVHNIENLGLIYQNDMTSKISRRFFYDRPV